MTDDLPPRWYADEAEKHARNNPPGLSELQRKIDDLDAEIASSLGCSLEDATRILQKAMRVGPNRWAAFTNAELKQISGRTYDARWWLELSEEALAELERRKP